MAQHEATVALDFLSLISSLNSEMAYTTLTPGLKEVIPPKAMGVEKISTKYPPQLMQDDRLISQGWKMEGLDSAGDALLRAASRLKAESEKEKRYWEQIMSIRDEGWTICKHPKLRNTLGVRYGFAETAANFENTGIGALRRGDDGSIDLEDPGASRTRRVVRVRIVDAGTITGCARPLKNCGQTPTLKEKILLARDYIYEEELYFEIMKEARHMASQGVTTSEDTVTIEMKAGRCIHIDMAPIDEEVYCTGESDDLAQAVGIALRILLSYGHRITLRNRSRPQRPLFHRKGPPGPLPLLRPMVTHLWHYEHSEHLIKFCGHLRDIVHSAGLPTTVIMNSFKNCQASKMKDIESSIAEFIHSPLESEAILELPGGWRVTIVMRTHLAQPWFGTTYAVTASHDGVCARLMGRNNITAMTELETYLLWCLERSIVNAIRLMEGQGWEQLAQGNSMEKNDGKTVKLIKIHVEKGGLHVRSGYVGGRDSEYVWTGSKKERNLEDVLREI
ncbi:subunit 17 of mediator complex-domain-containing protein [Terfezia claveryi]|nr:subunit 17 of mediator complex-domain-containing protein [Terfezia claveryi]